MAILFPSLEQIARFRVRATPGELHLLGYLQDNLDDSFEVYYNAFLNGDRPDIVVMRKQYGVFIIEVKDWNLENYYLDERKRWFLRSDNQAISSPIQQVLRYKQNLYFLHIDKLLDKKINNFRFWLIVSCGVYFHNSTEQQIRDRLVTPYEQDEKYQEFLKHNIELLGRDNINVSHLNRLLERRHLISETTSYYFDQVLYNSFKRYLQPPIHKREEGIPIDYTSKQRELIRSEARDQRIKGVVGSGKTTVLAARAVNAYLRHHNKVLVLTYNVTLKNYIHDKISNVIEEFPWDAFYITNYHNFINTELNNLGIPISVPDDFDKLSQERKSEFFESEYYSNVELFQSISSQLEKYDTILIDEIQDYKRPWMDIIKGCFLSENGEYVLFGDEKQNIYSNELENKDIKTNVPQRPSELKDCFRLDKRIKTIALKYQRKLFLNKYEIDDFGDQPTQGEFSFGNIEYQFLAADIKVDYLYEEIMTTATRLNQHPNDIAVLGMEIKGLRKLDVYYRYKCNEKTNAMFESQEVWYKLFLDSTHKLECIDQGTKLFGRYKKEDDKRNALAKAFTLEALKREFNNGPFTQLLIAFLLRNNVTEDSFLKTYNNPEVIDLLKKPSKEFREAVKAYREYKKVHFWANSGTMKLSTIHSFKGWEANTLFLLIAPDADMEDLRLAFAELIYTGLTRSRLNLIILNCGNEEYDALFKDLLRE